MNFKIYFLPIIKIKKPLDLGLFLLIFASEIKNTILCQIEN